MISALWRDELPGRTLTESHFIEFSGVTPPNSRMVTAESVGLLNLFESDAVPQNTLPRAANALSSPVAAGFGAPVVVAGGVVAGGVVAGAVVATPG